MPRQCSIEWNDEQVQLVVTYWRKLTPRQIGTQLGVSRDVITRRARKLGLGPYRLPAEEVEVTTKQPYLSEFVSWKYLRQYYR